MLAAMYLCVKGFAVLMNADTDPYVVICASRRDYMKRDKGGAIYTVPAVTFRATPQVGLENSEMVSRSAVDVLAKEIYKTSTAALQEAGIALYFVNDSDFQMLVKAKDERKCLSSLPISLVRG